MWLWELTLRGQEGAGKVMPTWRRSALPGLAAQEGQGAAVRPDTGILQRVLVEEVRGGSLVRRVAWENKPTCRHCFGVLQKQLGRLDVGMGFLHSSSPNS